MVNNEVKKMLYEIDVILSRIPVAEDAVFSMCDARRLLKAVFNELSKTPEKKEE